MKNLFEKYRDSLYIGLFSAVLCLFVFYTCIPREFTDDDWGIANYFAGVMGAEYATPYNKFINFVWGWVMYAMYQLVPGPNWFIVIQEIIVVLSFAILQFVLIQKLKEVLPFYWCYLLSSVLMIAFEPSFICRLEYTQTTALGCIAGTSLMIYSYGVKSRKGYTAGVVLTIISALHRFGSFEMCMPFICLMGLDNILRYQEGFSFKEIKASIWRNKQVWLSIVSIFASCLVLSKINVAIYNSEYYAEYNDFNSARASVVDYPKADYADIADGLEKIGVSENDYAMMTSWTFADLSFFTADLFKEVAKLEPKQSKEIDYGKEVQSYFAKLTDSTIVYNKLFYMALIILALSLIIDFKHMSKYIPLFLVGTILIEMYLTIIVRRYPSYCKTGLMFALIASVLTMTDFSKMRMIPSKYAGVVTTVMSVLILFGLAPMGNEYYLSAKGQFQYNMDGLAMYEYMNNRENDIFMISTGNNGGLPALRNSYSIFEATKPGIMHHTVGWGGWSTNNPWVNEAYHSWGIDYPLSQAADENVYLLATIAKVDSIRTYLKEHRDMDTSASLSAIEYGTTIWKLTDNNLNVKEGFGKGIIDGIRCVYDDTYGTYDISIDYSCDDSYVGRSGRLFLSLTDQFGVKRYFMVYDGQDVSILSNNNSVTAKVPVSYIDNKEKYVINVVLECDEENFQLCVDDTYFRLEEYLH